MKKLFRNITILLLAAMLIIGVFAPAFAEDTGITVETEEAGMVFFPAAEHNDLFNNFKGCMPGDELTQVIELKNLCETVDWMTYSMKAVVHDETNPPVYTEDYVSMNEFLHQLSMTVKRGEDVIYEASPDEADGLAEFVELAKLAAGESVVLTVTLTVPEDLGNEYMNRIGEVDWVFNVEGDVIPTPPTGDTNNSAIWYVLMAVGAAALLVAVFAGRKKANAGKAN